MGEKTVGFVVSAEFTSGGAPFRNYIESESMFGFRSWTSDLDRAKRFDTRALARRAAGKEKNIRIELSKLET